MRLFTVKVASNIFLIMRYGEVESVETKFAKICNENQERYGELILILAGIKNLVTDPLVKL